MRPFVQLRNCFLPFYCLLFCDFYERYLLLHLLFYDSRILSPLHPAGVWFGSSSISFFLFPTLLLSYFRVSQDPYQHANAHALPPPTEKPLSHQAG